MKYNNEEVYLNWLDKLSIDGFVVIDDFIPDNLYSVLRNYFFKQWESFNKAGVGTQTAYKVDNEIRGDYIYWLSSENDFEVKDLFERTDELIHYLKRYCFLSISGFELHLAHYPAGSFYKKHLDQFNNRSNRLISFVLYLNENWKPGDGGELKIFREPEDIIVEPIDKRLVLFKSDKVWHEVLPTRVSRYSVTGWMLHQPVGLGFL